MKSQRNLAEGVPGGLSRRQLLVAGTAAAFAGVLDPGALGATRSSKLKPPELAAAKVIRRYMAAAIALPDGRFMVSGGYSSPWTSDRVLMPLGSALIYDPESDSVVETASMKVPRARHASVALPEGRVAVLGGYGVGPLSSVEVYDPATNSWTASQALSQPRYDHCAAVRGGAIYVMGGSSQSVLGSIDVVTLTA
jgi:hypothetical protein